MDDKEWLQSKQTKELISEINRVKELATYNITRVRFERFNANEIISWQALIHNAERVIEFVESIKLKVDKEEIG